MKHPNKLTLIGSALVCGAVLPPSSQRDGIGVGENPAVDRP